MPTTTHRAEPTYQDALRLRREGDSRGATQEFLAAARAGHPAAAYELSLAYSMGRGVATDSEAGAVWLANAAELGDSRAQFLLGAAMISDESDPEGVADGLAYLTRAAAQGHSGAQYLLGKTFVDGHGVSPDAAWAARWYGKAAWAGHAQAQFAYGVMHATGLGVPPSNQRGYKWLTLAAEQHQPQADAIRKRLSENMTPAQIQRARGDAYRFVPSHAAMFADKPTVMYVQQMLDGLGYDAGPVDGIVGPRTRSGIRAFHKERGIKVDAEVSPALVDALRTAGR